MQRQFAANWGRSLSLLPAALIGKAAADRHLTPH